MIKTKVIFPFIYFFVDPNIVFVFEIKTRNYTNVQDLQNLRWGTFELNPGESFDTFDHKENKSVEGKSYFINQDGVAMMVEEINKQIQHNRQDDSVKETKIPIHIVSPEFAAGSLKVGLERPKKVIGFPDFFGIGPLWKLEEKIGQGFRNEWLYENINYEQEDHEYQTKFQNALLEIEDVPTEVPIYIWCGNNASEQTGIRFILYLLRHKDNEVFLLNSTELYEKYITSENQSIIHTGQLNPEDARLLFEKNKNNKPLSNHERKQFQAEWKVFSETTEVLRVWENGKIKGVPEDHFDPQIIWTIERLHANQEVKDFIKAGSLISEILTYGDEYDSYFLEYRIRTLIYNGVFELKGIPKSMRHYSVRLRKNSIRG
ncbi:DUF1835 domain-containing protein [Pseudoneobacillus rhizosphaerae]|uniref:DUF1835 domain-containing protein n=1 Tax=Pseudoneobacillus rhizosphaerae TaxID=2880968 RepID=A0A9C7G7I9_9BACI|nr:DUF1835 domain-containing protein [Pseudoneobacillus rhizosphaerae]CAG9606950.1 hypothetical protein NEOCIP111885_00638 [Pseudoneobacillus rhizosphaerae]